MKGTAGMVTGLLALLGLLAAGGAPAAADGFDHGYAAYGEVLSRYVRPPQVDYAALKAGRDLLDRAVAGFATPAAQDEAAWSREQRMAFWINAYNAFTLRAIVDHYPIRSGWFTLQPRNSIRQIDGVWTKLTWQAAGRSVTLDDIEHRILRPTFKDARIHFAVNCASIGCPPLAAVPYRPGTLGAQLDEAARTYLASAEGLRIDGDTFRVSSIFKWYGDDFVAEYAPIVPGDRAAGERAVLGAIARYGPAAAAARARSGGAAIAFLDYNWSLNDTSR
jgi:hypothetical protein